MPRIIAPVSDPDEIRKEVERNTPLQPNVPQTAEQAASTPTPGLQVAPIPYTTARPAAELEMAIQNQGRKPLIGLYIIITLMLLSAASSFIFDSSPGSQISGFLTGLLGLGLLTRSNIARLLVVILGWISVVMSVGGLLFIIALSSGQAAMSSVLLVSLGMLAIQIVVLIYLSSDRVKSEFS